LRAYQQRGLPVYPVNPNETEVEGLKCYPDLASLPEPVHGVSIVTPPAVTEQIVEQATRAVGPFRIVADLVAAPKCAVDCNTYFASWVPSPDPTRLVFGLSHNRWDGIATDVYRPTFGSVPAPAHTMSTADRCSLGFCG
jgi:hypothetical protein